MILDIDHLALCLDSYEDGNNFLLSLGYKCKYSIKEKINLEIKKTFLKKISNSHDFALYKLQNCFGIEIINHGKCFYEKPRIIPKFENINSNFDKYPVEIKDFLELKQFESEIMESKEKLIFNKIVFKTNDIIKSKKFWECLGFKNSNKNILKFNSIFSMQNYEIILE